MTLHWQATGIEVHKVVVGPYENNVFTIRCTETGEALLIDAANEHEQLLELCQTLGVRTVVETHGHWDHIQAIPAIRDAGYEGGVAADDATMLPSYDFILEDDSVILDIFREPGIYPFYAVQPKDEVRGRPRTGGPNGYVFFVVVVAPA